MLWFGVESCDKLVGEFVGTGHTLRNKMMKNWFAIGGIATAVAAGVYVFWGPITERKKRRRGMVPGLLNLGSTCFLNSLLQGLAACPSFIRWLEKFSGATSSISHRMNRLSTTLLQLLKALSSDESGDEDVLDAGCVLEVLRLYRWHISSFEEQDAHELFHVLSSSLEEEKDLQPKVAHLFDMHSLESLPEQHEKAMTCRSRAPLHPIPCSWKFQHPFHGRLISNMSCKNCEQKSPVQYDSFESLSLSIPSPQWGRPISLDQCLQHFVSSEAIKEVECANCTKLQQGTVVNEPIVKSRRTTFVKQLKLGKLSQCLCIHLQRLTWSSEGTPIKRQEHVQFTEYLSMDHYKHNTFTQRSHQRNKHPANPLKAENTEDTREKSSSSSNEIMSHNNNSPLLNGTNSSVFLKSPGTSSHVNFMCDYRSSEHLFHLMAVVVHHGDMRSGHFVTYRRSPSSSCTSQWLWTSDDSVRKASLHEVLSSNAYMLFYEKVQRLNITLKAEQ